MWTFSEIPRDAKLFTWKYSNIPTASTTPIDKPILNTTNINVKTDGGGNGNGFRDNTVVTQEINITVETEQPPTALAKNAVKWPWL